MFLTEDLLSIIAGKTNKYGKEKGPQFVDTTVQELKKFFGLCIQMSLVKMPTLRDYWSSRIMLGGTPFASRIMTKDRFEALLKYLHFSDNNQNTNENCLYKIRSLLDLFNEYSKKYYNPGSALCIDESLVPFRGRIRFRQFFSPMYR